MIADRYFDGDHEYCTRQLSGISEVIDIAEQINSQPEGERSNCASINGEYSFTHTNSLEEAIKLCKYGWPEGRERVLKAMANLGIEDGLANLGQVIEYQHETAGDEPDIDRYLAGDPENMINYYLDESTAGRIVKLLVNVSQPSYMNPDIIMRRGIAIVAAVETAAAAGYGVQLEAAEHTVSRYDGQSLEYRIPLAQAGEYLNIDTVTFAITHPSFLRRLVFTLNENESDEIRDKFGFWESGGYGMPRTVKLHEDEHAIVIDKDDGLLRDDSEILPFATQVAKNLITSKE